MKSRERKGEAYVLICVFIIVFALIFSVLLYTSAAFAVIRIQKRNTKTALERFITDNSIEIYDSIKMGNDKTESLDSAAFTELLAVCCGLSAGGGVYSFISEDGAVKYYITEPVLLSEPESLKLTVVYTLYYPLGFSGGPSVTASMEIRVSSNLLEKFEP